MMKFPLCAVAVALMLLLPEAAATDEPTEAERKAFANCRTCHAITEGGKKLAGPPLGDIIGRQAGTRDGYAYSKAMRDAGRDGLVWNAATLDAYIANPRAVVKGKKFLPGIRNADTRQEIISHLARQSGS